MRVLHHAGEPRHETSRPWIAGADTERHVPEGIDVGRPAERVRGELAARADEFPEGTPLGARRGWRRRLEQSSTVTCTAAHATRGRDRVQPPGRHEEAPPSG